MCSSRWPRPGLQSESRPGTRRAADDVPSNRATPAPVRVFPRTPECHPKSLDPNERRETARPRMPRLIPRLEYTSVVRAVILVWLTLVLTRAGCGARATRVG